MLEGTVPGVEELGQQQQQQTPPSPEGQQPQAAAAVPETMYEVKVNGQTIKVPLSELTSGYSRQQDYTRKTTELAEQRKQYETQITEYQKQISEVQEFFSDPRVKAALAQLQAGVQDPSQPLTAAQAQQLMMSEAQRQEQLLQERLQSAVQDLEVKTLTQNYVREIDSTIAQLKAKHPVLADIDGFEHALRLKVSERQPQSLEEAKQIFNEIAVATAQRLEGRFQNQQKQAAAAQAKLVQGGIEPPGGTVPPMPQEKKFKLGSPDLLQAAVSDLLGTQQNR